MFHSFCTQINKDNNIIQGHFIRDCYIFSGRVPTCTLLYFFPNFYFGFGIGIGAIIVMFVIEFSLLKSKKNTTTNDVQLESKDVENISSTNDKIPNNNIDTDNKTQVDN